MRAVLAAGEDRRPRNWRSRRLGQLLARTEDPWEQAAIFSSLLEPERVARVVDTPHEAERLAALRTGLVAAEPRSPAAREAVRPLLVAEGPDEIDWIALSLALSLDEARSRDAGSAPPASACDAAAARPAHRTGLRLLRGLERMPWPAWRASTRRWGRGSRKPGAHEAH